MLIKNFLPHISTPLNQIVAWQGDQAVLNHTLQTRIHAWHTLLERTTGQTFALYINDSLEFASALFGGWLAGKTLYLPNNILPATCDALRGQVDGYLGDFPSHYSPLAPSSHDATFSAENFIHHKNTLEDFVGLVIYTSGTTGDAQAIPKRLTQLAAEVATLENLFANKIKNAEIIATVSHEHIYGLLFKILWPLTASRVIHVRSAVFLEELAPTLTTRECVLITSPAHLKRFAEIPNAAITTPYLNAIFSSGAPLAPDVAQAAGRILGHIPIEIYGSSETGGIAWRQRNIFAISEINEAWHPLPNVEWRVTKENILEIRSPHLPDHNWFRTADRASPFNSSSEEAISYQENLDPSLRWDDNTKNNCFLLQGRVDRIVKLEGKRISLDAIERALMQSPLIAQARVLMLDENNQRQRIAAFIVPTAAGQTALNTLGKPAVNQQLRDLLINKVERIALPRTWRYLAAMPVNKQGKTTRAALMALLEPTLNTRPTLPQHQLIEQTSHRAVCELKIPDDLLFFEGHFPAAAILPGVVQLDWAIYYGRQYFNLPPYFCGIHTLKFQNVILPGATITLELLHDTAKSALQFRLYSAIGQHASGRILFSAEKNI